ncbi:uncharacterized protein C2845_PM01G25010 [Panicum miliaceum]|uniref:Uncharacterized protein n=1 Tax=Panicum miliaceum TaxID=4540 RepID=A0A3L6TIJ2_PANMI|nr:uncharacterized protein C2845_PM01G25010 [Panicum miliaceum]
MAGLKALGYKFDNDEFHANVHGALPYHNLRPDPVLRTLLLSIPQRKIVFTNSDKAHAEEALHRLGLQDCFDGVICFETLNPCNGLSESQNCMEFKDETFADLVDLNESDGFRPKSPILCKPSIEAMEAAIRIANIDPKKTILFDDSTRNIASGKAAGFHTVIVRRVHGRHLFPGLTVLWKAFITSRKLCPRYGMVRIGRNLKLFLLPALSELQWLLECVTLWVIHPVMP